MYALALSHAGSALTDATSTLALPYVHLGAVEIGPLPIQAFGVIVAIGVLIGAALLRRYAEWHGVPDDDIRGLLGWITVTGFLGAHWFDVIAYQADKPWFEFKGWRPGEWPLWFQLWSGISSYGGFLGGAMGFAFYVWWKRLNTRLMADVAIVGLLPAFSIGRIGCTVVSDHIGRAIDPNAWYAFIAMDYPTSEKLAHSGIAELVADNPTLRTAEVIPAWNLGFVELLWLIPVNALILWLAFRKKRVPAGFIIVLTGVLYAPVRFFLDFLRPLGSDPRYFDLTFAQWTSLLAFGASVYVAYLIKKKGAPYPTIAPTSGEAQAMLNLALKGDDEEDDDGPEDKKPTKKGDLPKATASKKKSDEKASKFEKVVTKKKEETVDPKKEEEKRKAKELEEARALEKKQKEDAEEIAAAERRKKQDEALAVKKKADDEKKKADDEKKKADDEKTKADDEKTKADDEKTTKADDEKTKADDKKTKKADDKK
ncbi:MAG: prolipoprotein diacylglyceryl transferase [Kofleriaceae bacterium]